MCSPVLSLGPGVYGYDESTDDHSTADAADPVPSSASGLAAATAGSHATAGKTRILTHTQHTHTHALSGPSPSLTCSDVSVLVAADTQWVRLYLIQRSEIFEDKHTSTFPLIHTLSFQLPLL